MQKSRLAKPNGPHDKMSNRTVRLADSFWRQLQAEAERRELSISDLIVEAFSARLVKINREDT